MRSKTLCITAAALPTAAAEARIHILCLDGFSFGKLGHFDDGCGSLFHWIAFLAEERRSRGAPRYCMRRCSDGGAAAARRIKRGMC